MKRHLRHFSFLLVILALISAGISPACVFISGKTSLIEICTADGGVRTVAVTEDGRQITPFDHQDHKNAKTDCAFCLNAAAAKSGPADGRVFYAAVRHAPPMAQAPAAALAEFPAKSFHATGPPASFML